MIFHLATLVARSALAEGRLSQAYDNVVGATHICLFQIQYLNFHRYGNVLGFFTIYR